MDVIIKENQAQELEEKLASDRFVTIENGITHLYEIEFTITDEMIKEKING